MPNGIGGHRKCAFDTYIISNGDEIGDALYAVLDAEAESCRGGCSGIDVYQAIRAHDERLRTHRHLQFSAPPVVAQYDHQGVIHRMLADGESCGAMREGGACLTLSEFRYQAANITARFCPECLA